MKQAFWKALLCLALPGLCIHAQPATAKFIVAPTVLCTDPTPAREADLGPGLHQEFVEQFRGAFPKQILDLDNERPGPDDRVIIVLPILSGVRILETIRAGSIHSFEAVAVGSINALDPWSDANLYSATRMVKVPVELGSERLDQKDFRLQEAFRKAISGWMGACIVQIKNHCQPFVLFGPVLEAPPGLSSGGLWPFGTSRGLRSGMGLQGKTGTFKLEAVFPKYSLVVDAVNTLRPIPVGESLRLLVVANAAEREEALVELDGTHLDWPTQAGSLAPQDQKAIIPADLLLSFAREYLSKDQNLRLLPIPLPESASIAWADLRRRLNEGFSTVREVGQMVAIDRAGKAKENRDNPALRIEFGGLNAYHGRRQRADGVVEHLFRYHLVATILRYRKATFEGRDTDSNLEGAPLSILSVVDHTEELALQELAGIRKVDLKAAWFSLCRNGMIRLSDKVRERLLQLPLKSSIFHEGKVGKGAVVDWPLKRPTSGQPLEWLRPRGEVKDMDGRPLGIYFQKILPSQGFLNQSSLSKEQLQSGDVLRFRDKAAEQYDLCLMPSEVDPASGIPKWVAEAFLVRSIQSKLHANLLRMDNPDQRVETDKGLKFLLSGWTQQDISGAVSLSSQWRLRLLQLPQMPEAMFKNGIQTEHVIRDLPEGSPPPPLTPPDRQGAKLRVLTESMERLAQSALQKGLVETLHKHFQEKP